MSEMMVESDQKHVLDIVPDRSQWKLGAVALAVRIAIHIGDWTCTPVWASQAVQTDNEEPCSIERPSRPPHQWTPPVSYISAPR